LEYPRIIWRGPLYLHPFGAFKKLIKGGIILNLLNLFFNQTGLGIFRIGFYGDFGD